MVIVWLCVSILLIIVSTTRLKLHPILALLLAALVFGLGTGEDPINLLATINSGFGGTIGNIGIIIIAGLIIGIFLEKSGGAISLSQTIMKIIGKERIHSAMAMMGYIVSIPVFADSGYIILSALNKTLSRNAGVSMSGTAIALSLGLMATHTMVPPTPGPIAAAGIINADIGRVILYGLIASLIALFVCIKFAKYMGRKVFIESISDSTESPQPVSNAPKPIHASLPILIPIVLILLKSINDLPSQPLGTAAISNVVGYIGHPVSALIIGMIVSFTLPKKLSLKNLGAGGWVGQALNTGAVIVLITGAGGAFGKVLQQSDLSSMLEASLSTIHLGIWLPYLIALALKTAQGSSTVAIITTASIISPLLGPMGLDSDTSQALAVVAIGAGAAGISHANDSFFWVVTQMSGMTVSQGYKLHSLGTFILGLSAMLTLSLIQLFV